MIVTLILASICAIVIILVEAQRVPAALAAFVRSCIPLVHALGELRAAIIQVFRHPAVPALPSGDENSAAPRTPDDGAEDPTATDAGELSGL